MAQATLVEVQFNDGQRLIDRLSQGGIAVTAASWVKESDSGDWYLYLATSLVGEDGATRPAYHQLNNVIRAMQQEGFAMDPFEIKLIGPKDPIANDLLAHRRGRPGGPPSRFQGSRLGDLAIEEAYIYPRPPTTEESVGLQLWNCGGIKVKPGIRQNGWSRVVVIDQKNQTVLPGSDQKYSGIMEEPTSLRPGQVEITWVEGGAMRIIEAGSNTASSHRWRWSQPRIIWEEGGCLPDQITQAILAALG